MFDVYCHINKFDQKRYVGFSQYGMEKRWSGHLTSSRSGSQHYFHRAIRLHGEANFDHVLLEQCETIEAAREAEIWWIGHFCSDDPRFGYNMTSGGEGCPSLTEESRRRKSEKIKAWYRLHPEARRGKRSQETRDKIRAALTNPTPEVRKRRSEGAMRGWEKRRAKEGNIQ